MEKGVAFPCCVSVNNQVCHNSPPSDDGTALAEGQGLTLVHILAQRKRFVWDRGCAWGLCSPC